MLLQPLLRNALNLLACIRVTVVPCSRVTVLPFLLFSLSPFVSAQVGKVGINTTTPAAMLHVKDSSVLFTGLSPLPVSPGAPPVSGPGTRMMWYPDKAAFRAGRIIGTQWDKDSIGIHSAAFGLNLRAKGSSSFIGGGADNQAAESNSFVGGGASNKAFGFASFVGGGTSNTASGSRSFAGGGESNTASGIRSFVGGGFSNMATAERSFVGGGTSNVASAERSFVGGGSSNMASGSNSFIGGGATNVADTTNAFVGGGTINLASAVNAYVGGGSGNMSLEDNAFVGGGEDNTASNINAFVGGGSGNTAGSVTGGINAFVGGGMNNTATENHAFVGGGLSNNAAAFAAFIGGGVGNTTSGARSFVGGGESNTAAGERAYVGGGSANQASGINAVVGGGMANVANGNNAFTGGGVSLLSKSFGEAVFGLNNTDYTPASTDAFNANDRLFVIGNGTSSSARSNAVTVLKNGRMGIGTATPAARLHVKDSSVVFTGLPLNPPPTAGPPPLSGPGARMMWYADKAAFRAGAVEGNQWNKDSVGLGSAAFGLDVKAKGALSFVGGGYFNTASGTNAFAGGGTSLQATGSSSFVGGGDNNRATGFNSFSGGGQSNISSAEGAFVGGGFDNTASGEYSFSSGAFNAATSEAAFIGGGAGNQASGVASFTGGGTALLSKSAGEAVFGWYNTDYTPASATTFNANDRLFVIGNGTSSTARSNAVTVLKNGRVGIRTDSPDLLMELRGDSLSANAATIALGGRFGDRVEAGRIRFLDGTASTNWRGIYMHHDGTLNKFHIGVHTANTNVTTDDIPIITVERGDNQVGIGTTTPGFLLEVNGDAGKPGGGSWSASSDARLKTDVQPYTDGLQSVLAIDPVTYRYNALSGYDTKPTHVGVIAQQLQEVTPYMVSVSDRIVADGSMGYLAVDNSAMTYMLINAVKEQQAIIEELQDALQQEKADKADLAAEVRQLSEALADIKAMLTARPATAITTAQVTE